ncbi:MAG: hypothetical protein ACUVXI_17740 [bacterium]
MNRSAEAWETSFLKALERSDLSLAIEILEERRKSTGTPHGADKVKALGMIQLLKRRDMGVSSWRW